MDKIDKELIVEKVAVFLERNYPCSCDNNDPDCPGSIYEAEAIVDMVLADVAKAV